MRTRNRASTGGVLERPRKDGVTVFYLRFRADVERDGRVVRERFTPRLGSEDEGWTRERAEQELDDTLTLIRKELWSPPERSGPPVVVAVTEPTFHEYSSEWFARREAEGLAVRSLMDLRGSLSNHLLPFFKDHRLSDITVREVERYKQAKLAERAEIEARRAEAAKRGERCRERPLSNGSINHTLRHLAQVLEAAVDEELIEKNAAAGRKRRLKAEKPSRPWVEPEQLASLFDAALDEDGRAGVGRVLLGVLAGTGLRISEALDLRWSDLDLGKGTLHVRASKTDAGIRRVDLPVALHEELVTWKLDAKYTGPTDPVIQTGRGGRQNPSNLRRDVLAPAVAEANDRLAKLGIAPIPTNLGFHGFRRTFATLAFLNGEDLGYVADQIGHEDPSFTMRVYRQSTRTRPDRLPRSHRAEYDRALEWARIGGAYRALPGTRDAETVSQLQAEATKSPV
jgi:integrase